MPRASACRRRRVIEIRLPADLVAGYEFVTTGVLDKNDRRGGQRAAAVLTNKPRGQFGLADHRGEDRGWRRTVVFQQPHDSHNTPIVVNDGSAARKRIEAAFDEFRQMFPAALCYTKIVPVDEVVTLTLFHREDDHLGG